MSPEMMWDEFEESMVARPYLVDNIGIIQNARSLDVGPLFAEMAFEKVLPSNFDLGVNKHARKMGSRLLGFIRKC